MKTLIQNGTLVNEGRVFRADILIDNDTIETIEEKGIASLSDDVQIIDAEGKYVIPGVIDDQVHFREPGLTRKGDIGEGSRLPPREESPPSWTCPMLFHPRQQTSY